MAFASGTSVELTGSTSWTVPSVGSDGYDVTAINVQAYGSGGVAGTSPHGKGGGGGGGAFAQTDLIAVTPGEVLTITAGAGNDAVVQRGATILVRAVKGSDGKNGGTFLLGSGGGGGAGGQASASTGTITYSGGNGAGGGNSLGNRGGGGGGAGDEADGANGSGTTGGAGGASDGGAGGNAAQTGETPGGGSGLAPGGGGVGGAALVRINFLRQYDWALDAAMAGAGGIDPDTALLRGFGTAMHPVAGMGRAVGKPIGARLSGIIQLLTGHRVVFDTILAGGAGLSRRIAAYRLFDPAMTGVAGLTRKATLGRLLEGALSGGAGLARAARLNRRFDTVMTGAGGLIKQVTETIGAWLGGVAGLARQIAATRVLAARGAGAGALDRAISKRVAAVLSGRAALDRAIMLARSFGATVRGRARGYVRLSFELIGQLGSGGATVIRSLFVFDD